MLRSRLRPRATLAIAWLVIVAGVARAGDEQRGTLVERNRETIGALFDGDRYESAAESRRNIGSNVAMPYSKFEETPRKSLAEIRAPQIFEDPDNSVDADARAPHVRVKRIANLFDSPPEAIPSHKRPSPLYTNRRHMSRRFFKRFSPEEANPADENETEYSNAFEDDDIDIPGAFLNDQRSKKRNNLEDVYPDIMDYTNRKERPSDNSHHTADTRELIRSKRDKEDDEEEDEEEEGDNEADADKNECIENGNDNEGEYYYDEENKQEAPNLRDEKQAIQPRPQAVDSHEDAVNTNGDSKSQHSQDKSTYTMNADSEKSKIHKEDAQLSENNKELNTQEDLLRFPSKQERLAALTDKTIIVAATKDLTNNERNQQNNRPEKIKKSSNSGKLREKVANEKVRVYPITKAKFKVNKDVSAKISPMKMTMIEATLPESVESNHQKMKSAHIVHNPNIDHKDAVINENAKLSKLSANCHKNEASYCGDQERQEVLDSNDKERNKRNRKLVIKTIPKGNHIKELQIYEKIDASKNHKGDKNLAQVDKNQIESKEKTEQQSLGELKNLLRKLIVKVEDLGSIMSEIRSISNNQQQLLFNEQLTRSQFPVDSQRSGRPCASKPSASSSPQRRPKWGSWSEWGGCNVTCGKGQRNRSRRCLQRCGDLVAEYEKRICRYLDCPPSKFLGVF